MGRWGGGEEIGCERPGLKNPMAWKDRTGNARRGDSFSPLLYPPADASKNVSCPQTWRQMLGVATEGGGDKGQKMTKRICRWLHPCAARPSTYPVISLRFKQVGGVSDYGGFVFRATASMAVFAMVFSAP